MKLDFEYGQGLMSANLPDNTDIFVPGETVPDPECLPQARRRSQRETIPYLIQTKDSPRRKTIPSICGLGARFGCSLMRSHPNRRD